MFPPWNALPHTSGSRLFVLHFAKGWQGLDPLFGRNPGKDEWTSPPNSSSHRKPMVKSVEVACSGASFAPLRPAPATHQATPSSGTIQRVGFRGQYQSVSLGIGNPASRCPRRLQRSEEWTLHLRSSGIAGAGRTNWRRVRSRRASGAPGLRKSHQRLLFRWWTALECRVSPAGRFRAVLFVPPDCVRSCTAVCCDSPLWAF